MVARTRTGEGSVTMMIVHESRSHVVVAVEMHKQTLAENKRLLETLLAIARGYESLAAVAAEISHEEDRT